MEKVVAVFSNSLRYEAVSELRLFGPLSLAGYKVIYGKDLINSSQKIDLSGVDFVTIQRDFPRYWTAYNDLVSAARHAGIPVIYDIDDLLWELPIDHPDRKSLSYVDALLPMLSAAATADLVTVSTPALMAYIKLINANVSLLPNYLNDTIWNFKQPKYQSDTKSPVVIGYMGSYTHDPDIKMILPAIKRLLKEYDENLILRFLGQNIPAELQYFSNVEARETWCASYSEFATVLSSWSCDIGIAPLTSNLFNCSKSPIKFFEYSCIGVAGVYTKITPYEWVVTNGSSGFLASTQEEWYSFLKQLIDEPRLRHDMALTAQKTVQEKWFLSSHANEWKEAYGKISQVPSIEAKNINYMPETIINITEQIQDLIYDLRNREAEKELSVQLLTMQMAEKEQAAQLLTMQLAEKEQSEQTYISRLAGKELLLNEIFNSKVWKVALLLRRTRVLIAPPNSRRVQAIRKLYKFFAFPIVFFSQNQKLMKDINLIRSSSLFDEAWYLANNPDIAQAEIDPARHYLLYGGFEGRDPGPYFSTGWYLTTYEDVEKSGINPLIHYLEHGREEGRSAQSADVINEHDSTDSFEMNQIDSNNRFVPLMDENFESQNAEIKLIAFYLPQYHPIPENDAWWGKGFTEWTNVSKAKPNFMGHYQPHLPGELGFYDLRIPEIQERQVELAKKYGIYGFCFYYYWFDRKRLLELPINNFMKNPNIDFPFCLCWANENWSRTWDGSENNILIAQNYSEESHLNFIRDIAPALLDKRYIRVDGKPLLLVYNVNSIPNPQQAVEIWRAEAKKIGIGEVYLVAVQSFGITDPRPFGFDAAIEFPPHPFGHTPNILHDMVSHKKMPQITNPQFNGGIFDYQQTALLFSQKKAPDYTLFKTIIPSWDNTARRQNTGDLFINSSPRQYRKWLDKTIKYTRDNFSDDKRFIFINAWNEWGEGTYLEPDRLYGYAYLQATYDSLMNKNVNVNVYESVSDPNKGEKNTQIKTVHSIRTLFQSITLERVRKALGYFVRGDIKNLKYKLLFLSQNTEPDSIYDTEKIELEYCAQFFRPKTENQTFQGKLKQEIDIIVPVFNGMDFLPVLFDSLYKNTDEPFRVIIIDDKSTDISVRPFLENLAAKYRNILLLFNEENKGFVKTINIASTHVQNHFVILNTDVEVPEGWLQRLMKPIIDDKNIASTTPFTNAGTIFSFPQINVDNNIFAGLDVNKVDSVFKLIDADLLSIDVPTGVGFCMGMNLDVWKKIGNFDENAFGRGYGEENDWCLRANSAGYRNVMVPNLFVYHKHGGSFLPEEKQKLIQGNLQKIFNRYPNYPVSVDNYIKSDPPKPLRMFASLLLMKIAANTEPVLVIDHGLGGGAGDYCTELVQKRLQAGQVVFLLTYSGPLQAIKLQVLYKEYETFFKVSNIEELLILRDFLKFGEILYNNLVGYSDPVGVLKVILQIKNYSGAKLVAFVHDYYLICPSYTLIDNHGNYCDLPPLEICKNCLPKNSFRTPHDQENILVWREAWAQFLDGADEVVCFSKNSQDLIKRAYAINDDKITVIPHNLLYTFKTRPNVNFKEPLCIGVVGTLNYHKGQAMVLELAKILAAKYPDIRIVIIGTTTVPISSSNITITGRYEKSDLPGLIEKYKINLCFFPSIWPETFSYVTSELMDLEMPICSFNLGAPAERIGQYKLGHLISEITAETAAREIVSFYSHLKSAGKEVSE